MALFAPRLEDLPAEFPIFPLSGALLLPRGKLPLNIFEPRYLAMTFDSLAAGRMFGMVQPDPQAAQQQAGPGLYRVGCLGRIASFSETEDGRLLITLTGLIRFDVEAELQTRNGYRRLRADYSRFHGDLQEDDTQDVIGRDKILTALRGYFQVQQVQANWDAIRSLSDDALIVTLAMACPFEPVEKQAILEAPTEAERADVLLTLLEMGAVSSDLPPGHSVS